MSFLWSSFDLSDYLPTSIMGDSSQSSFLTLRKAMGLPYYVSLPERALDVSDDWVVYEVTDGDELTLKQMQTISFINDESKISYDLTAEMLNDIQHLQQLGIEKSTIYLLTEYGQSRIKYQQLYNKSTDPIVKLSWLTCDNALQSKFSQLITSLGIHRESVQYLVPSFN